MTNITNASPRHSTRQHAPHMSLRSNSSLLRSRSPPPAFEAFEAFEACSFAIVDAWLADQAALEARIHPTPPPQTRKRALSTYKRRCSSPRRKIDGKARKIGTAVTSSSSTKSWYTEDHDAFEEESEDELRAPSLSLERARLGQWSAPWTQHTILDEGYADTLSPEIAEDIFETPRPHLQRERQPTLHLSFQALHHSSSPATGSTHSQVFSLRQHTSQSNTLSNASTQSSGSQKTKRATNPCTNLADLQLLNKPVSYGVLNLEGTDAVPNELQTLVNDVYHLCRDVGTVPVQVKDQISARLRQADLNSLERDDFEVRLELDAMQRAQNAAVDLTADSAHEAPWCCSVIWPILDTAFRFQPHIKPANISSARPLQDLLPQRGEHFADAKLVDFAITLIPQTITQEAITNWLRSQPPNMHTVSQSRYPQLRLNPTTVPLKVSVSGLENEAKIQMAIWVSAWHERVRLLGRTGLVIALPVIIVLSHQWYMYFAIDHGNRIEMLQFPDSIGDTLTLLKTYRLLAVLRRLGEWAAEDFEPWFKTAFLGIT